MLRGVSLHYKTPYTQSVNLVTQYALSTKDSFEVGYVGSMARHLEAFIGTNHVNELLPPGTATTSYITFPDFAEAMLELGVYVIAFSFPVVPREQARIRVQISAAHSSADIDVPVWAEHIEADFRRWRQERPDISAQRTEGLGCS